MKKLIFGICILVLVLGTGGYYYATQQQPKKHKTTTTAITGADINAITSIKNGGVVIDFGSTNGAPMLKSTFGIATNIASDGLLESVKADYIDDLGPGLFCTQVAFDGVLRTDKNEVNPAFTLHKDDLGRQALNPAPTEWMRDFETTLASKNIQLLVQLGGAPAPYQPAKISKPAVHPAPTDGPDFSKSAKLIGDWTATQNHLAPILWSIWHEPEHNLLGISRSKDLSGDFIAPYSKDNTEPKALYDARDAAARTNTPTLLDTIYRAWYAAMKPTLSPYSHYGLAGFLNSGFDADKLTAATALHPAEPVFKAFIDEHTARNTTPVPLQFLSFDSYNGHWQEVVQGSRKALTSRTDIGPLIFNEYAPSNMKFADDGDHTPTEQPTASDNSIRAAKAAKGKDANPTTIDAALAMLSDMSGIIEQPDIAHFCMSYWTGGEDGILDRNNNTGTVAPTVRYAALKLYSELPVAHAALSGANVTAIGTPGLHGLAGIDSGRMGILLWNDGSESRTTTLELKNIPTAFSKGNLAASIQTITSDADTTPNHTAYTGQPLTIPAHSIMLVTLEKSDAPVLLDRRHSLGNETVLLTTMPMTDRSEISCVSGTCTMPTGHYAAYDAVRSIAYLGTIKGGHVASTSVTYMNLPKVIYASVQSFSNHIPENSITMSASVAGCTATTPPQSFSFSTRSQTLELRTLDTACGFDTSTKPVTLSFTMQSEQTNHAEIYLSANKAEADAITTSISEYNILNPL